MSVTSCPQHATQFHQPAKVRPVSTVQRFGKAIWCGRGITNNIYIPRWCVIESCVAISLSNGPKRGNGKGLGFGTRKPCAGYPTCFYGQCRLLVHSPLTVLYIIHDQRQDDQDHSGGRPQQRPAHRVSDRIPRLRRARVCLPWRVRPNADAAREGATGASNSRIGPQAHRRWTPRVPRVSKPHRRT
jgi:hypothetical protein